MCEAEGIGVIPWSPLARGRLTRPWSRKRAPTRGKDEFGKPLWQNGRVRQGGRDRANELAKKLGIPQAQITLAWVLQKSYITSPIIGATKMEHLDDAVAALAVKLSPEEIASLEEPYVPHAVVGFS